MITQKQASDLQLLVYSKSFVDTYYLPKVARGRFWIQRTTEEGKEQIFEVAAEQKQWVRIENDHIYFEQREVTTSFDEQFKEILCTKSGEKLLLICLAYKVEFHEYIPYLIPCNIDILIGRDKNCDIVIDHPSVSAEHAVLHFKDMKFEIDDLSNKNGLYINKKRAFHASLRVGDVVHILGLQILIGPDRILLPNVPQNQLVHRLHEASVPSGSLTSDAFTMQYHSRLPLLKAKFTSETITVDAPPAPAHFDSVPFIFIIGPSITMGISSITMGVFALVGALQKDGDLSQAIPTVMMSVSMALGTILWPILTKKYEKKQKKLREKRRRERYREYLAKIECTILQHIEKEENYLRTEYEDFAHVIDILYHRQSHIWYRQKLSPTNPNVTLGLGDLTASLKLDSPTIGFQVEEDCLITELKELATRPRTLTRVPILCKLSETFLIGIVGKERCSYDFMLGLLLQLVILNSYHDVKIVVLCTDSFVMHYQIKWLAHLFNNEKQQRYLVCNEQSGKKVNLYLEQEFSKRRISWEDSDPNFIIFSFAPMLEKRLDVLHKIKQSNYIGFSFIQHALEIQSLYKECQRVITLNEADGFFYDENGSQQSFTFTIPTLDDIRYASKYLANISVQEGNTYQLPEVQTFLDLYRCGSIEQLNIYERWLSSDCVNSLEVAIGMNQHGEHLCLDAHENYHGPHGLVAGMTGSGKSECILTYIMSLAVNFSPLDVSFVLIDYKGGTMASCFKKLPHVAGIITNLDQESIQRSLAAMHSELTRRQKLFSKVCIELDQKSMDIYKYQRLMKEKAVSEPLSHLFIIADEFAELKTQEPDFMEHLKQAARIGRSLGIHLILATQKPSGVVDDQIWSNARFHICLKVQEKADSMDMLKREEAALLTKTGQFYLQVGYNEIFEKGLAAWTQAPYIEQVHYQAETNLNITMIGYDGSTLTESKCTKAKMKTTTSQLDEIVKYIDELANQISMRAVKIWKEAISKNLKMGEIQGCYTETEMLMGMVDDPYRQRQFAFQLPLEQLQNTVLFGMVHSGKTMFLTTYLLQLMQTYTIKGIQVYILDFDQKALCGMIQASSIGDVAIVEEVEKVHSLFYLVGVEITKRKAKHRKDYSQFLIVIHNYEAFHETYEALEEKLLHYVREGEKVGVKFLFTASSLNAISFRLLQYISKTIMLQMKEDSDYRSSFPDNRNIFPLKQKGSGIMQADEVYLFQCAYYEEDEIMRIIKTAKNKKSPPLIPVLPKRVSLLHVKEVDHICMGLHVETKQSVSYDIHHCQFHYVLCGFRYHSSFLHTFLKQLYSKYTNVFIFTPKGKLHSDEYRNNFDEVLIGIEKLPSAIIVWHQYSDIQRMVHNPSCLERIFQLDCMHHVFIDTMKGLQQFSMEPWFSNSLLEANFIWNGKGIVDYGYTLKLSTNYLNNQLADNRVYIWEDTTCNEVQILEEEVNG